MIRLEFTSSELRLLRTLLEQYGEILRSEHDPVLERLFPAAYRDDADAAAEFARYTRPGLATRKTAGAASIAAAIAGDDGAVALDDDEAAAWLPVLTDVRLILANRLGIVTDDDEVPGDELGQVYRWLGALQEHLVDALETRADP
ncbi:MAG: DUF2017 family protein [Microbacteriaceae bacterium]|nr:DUF2017 family protein [Microbacteriaceae bacterium]